MPTTEHEGRGFVSSLETAAWMRPYEYWHTALVVLAQDPFPAVRSLAKHGLTLLHEDPASPRFLDAFTELQRARNEESIYTWSRAQFSEVRAHGTGEKGRMTRRRLCREARRGLSLERRQETETCGKRTLVESRKMHERDPLATAKWVPAIFMMTVMAAATTIKTMTTMMMIHFPLVFVTALMECDPLSHCCR